jgi:hypothetical protein
VPESLIRPGAAIPHSIPTWKVAVLLLGLGLAAVVPAADHAITVDSGVRADPPLVKKLSLFNSGSVQRPAYERDLSSFGALKPDAWRIDLSIGKSDCLMWHDLLGGHVDSGLTYNWSQADWLKARFDEQDILPCWGLSYIPYLLQRRSGGEGWMTVDNADGGFRWDRWRQVGGITDRKSLLALRGVGPESEGESVRFHGRRVTKVGP